jgi:hypothetical protein
MEFEKMQSREHQNLYSSSNAVAIVIKKYEISGNCSMYGGQKCIQNVECKICGNFWRSRRILKYEYIIVGIELEGANWIQIYQLSGLL